MLYEVITGLWIVSFAGTGNQHAGNTRDDTEGTQPEDIKNALSILEQYCTQRESADDRAGVRLKQVRPHPGNVTYVIADVIGNDSWIARA